jgi:hypothetical protein
MNHTQGEDPANNDHPQQSPAVANISAIKKEETHENVDDGGGGTVPSDAVEIGGCITLSGMGGFLSRNASPYSSMRDVRNHPTTATAAPIKVEPPSTSYNNNNNNNISVKKQRKRENENYSNNNNANASSSAIMSEYGAPTLVTTTGNFPAIGSTLGPYYWVRGLFVASINASICIIFMTTTTITRRIKSHGWQQPRWKLENLSILEYWQVKRPFYIFYTQYCRIIPYLSIWDIIKQLS